jgi:hypothetical protein
LTVGAGANTGFASDSNSRGFAADATTLLDTALATGPLRATTATVDQEPRSDGSALMTTATIEVQQSSWARSTARYESRPVGLRTNLQTVMVVESRAMFGTVLAASARDFGPLPGAATTAVATTAPAGSPRPQSAKQKAHDVILQSIMLGLPAEFEWIWSYEEASDRKRGLASVPDITTSAVDRVHASLPR